MVRFFFIGLLCLGFVACDSIAGPVTPGIDGTWSAPVQPNGSIILELHPASGCAANAPCGLTGTFKDNRNGGHGVLTSAQKTGNTIHLEATIGAEAAQSDARCDLGLEQTELSMNGSCTIQGKNSNVPQTFQVHFAKQ